MAEMECISASMEKAESDLDDSESEDENIEESSINKKSLPEKSKRTYELTYYSFIEWTRKNLNKTSSFSEDVLLDYFRELSEKYKSPLSLWRDYSMLKSTLRLNHDVDIEKYSKLRAFLSRKTRGYQAKQTKTFTLSDFNKFLVEAPDDTYLVIKVAFIIGVMGACSIRELHSLSTEDIQDFESYFLITIPTRKRKRTFAVADNLYLMICRKYLSLRPQISNTSSLFLSYQNGKCTSQTIGVNTLGVMGKQIAKFLKLPNPESYTGRSFIKSSANIVHENEFSIENGRDETFLPAINSQNDDLIKTVPEEDKCMSAGESDVSDSDNNEMNELLEDSEGCVVSIPEKSKMKYELVYNAFMDWKRTNNIDSFSEEVILRYFKELSEKYASSSLLMTCSMLRSTLYLNHKVNLKSYTKLRSFLKNSSKGFQSKKTKTLTLDEIHKFINEAPNYKYLVTKVALIMGVIGACGTQELRSLNTENIHDFGTAILVTVVKDKTRKKFKITGHLYDVCKKYMKLRPSHAETTTFFLNYQKGKCTIQHIGINKISTMATQIAEFLNLPSPKMYTGLCFRKTAIKLRESGDISAALTRYSWNPVSADTTHMDDAEHESLFTSQDRTENMQDAEMLDSIVGNNAGTLGNNSTRIDEIFMETEETENSPDKDDVIIVHPNRPTCPLDALPKRTRTKYEHTYRKFMVWRNRKKINSFSEQVLLEYFKELSTKYMSATVWVIFSMLKTTIKFYNNIDIQNYMKLHSYLRQYKSFGSRRRSTRITKTFTPDEINRFITDAPDSAYLVTKVALIIGVTGSCSNYDLHSITSEDIKDLGSAILVSVPKFERQLFRKFIITDLYYDLCKKYIDLRPSNSITTVFFLNYQKGRCISRPIGIHKFAKMGIQIANFLKLPNPSLYGGSCFLKTAQRIGGIVNPKGDRSEERSLTFGGVSDNAEEESSFCKNWSDAEKSQLISEDEFISLNNEMSTTANTNSEDFIHKKLKDCYNAFIDWQNHENRSGFSEDVFLHYFKDLSKNDKSPLLLFREYCMLKNVILKNHSIVLSDYKELRTFLNHQLEQAKMENYKTFTADELKIFINEAPDDEYLTTKVALIMAITGNCDVDDLYSLLRRNVENHNWIMLVKTTEKTFPITGNLYEICKKYFILRSNNTECDSFFLHYKNSECTSEKMDRNQFMKIGEEIAQFLKLSNPEAYRFPQSLCEVTLDDENNIINNFKNETVENEYSTSDSDINFSDSDLEDVQSSENSMCKIENPIAVIKEEVLTTDEEEDESNLRLSTNSQIDDAKQAKMFTFSEVNKFITEAPDGDYLAAKVASVLGIVGDSTINEIHSLAVKDVVDLETAILVSTSQRKFLITDRYYQICKKYMDIRPADADTSSFFLIYSNGKCTTEKMDISIFSAMGKQIATFLNLPNSNMYSSEASFPKLSTLIINDNHFISESDRETSQMGSCKIKTECPTQSETEDYVFTAVTDDTSIRAVVKEQSPANSEYEEQFILPHNLDALPIAFKEELIDSDDESVGQLPEKSEKKYKTVYNSFMSWRMQNKINSFAEDVLVAYFKELSEKYTPSSLWAHYSMLRSTLGIHHKVMLKNYGKLRTFLKRNAIGYKSKKQMKTFTSEQVEKFIAEAHDYQYLAVKVVLIMGLAGACDRQQLRSLNIKDIQDFQSAMLVTVRKDGTIVKKFTITDNYYHICKKYISLRPQNAKSTSFFLNYQAGKCTSQNMGINKFGIMMRQIAEFLNLPDPGAYTGRLFRKSGGMLLS